MTNLIIASAKEQAEALDASRKLYELESIGDITVYEMVIIQKNAAGETVVLQADTAEGQRTVSGMAVGTLIGALAGPVGMMAGMFAGTLGGAAAEADHYGFAEDFISDAARQMQAGTTAVIAEIGEEDTIFVDSSLKPLSVTLTRSDVDYEYTKRSDEAIDELDEEITEAREKLKTANEKEKARILDRIAKLKEERREAIAEFKEKMHDAVADLKSSTRERKLEKLRSKIEKHHKKIADLEKQMQVYLGKSKDTLKPAGA